MSIPSSFGRPRDSSGSPGGEPLADHIRDADFDGIGVPKVPNIWAKLPIVAVGDVP
jgi:hypothetical protein